jgi:signal peptidase II
VAIVVVVIDQITKTLALDHLSKPVHLLGPLSLQLALNSGVAFSLGTGLGLPIVLIALVGLFILGFSRRRLLSTPAAIGSGLIMGGALGNLGDRLFRGNGGSVVDFIHTTFWPTFNVADSAVVCGCVTVFFVYWRANDARKEQTTVESPSERQDHD